MNHKKRSKLVKVNAAASLHAAKTTLSHVQILSRLAEHDRAKTGQPGRNARRALQLSRRVARLHAALTKLVADLGVGSFTVRRETVEPYNALRVTLDNASLQRAPWRVGHRHAPIQPEPR